MFSYGKKDTENYILKVYPCLSFMSISTILFSFYKKNVYINRSTIPCSGNGLFASKNFQPGDIVCSADYIPITNDACMDMDIYNSNLTSNDLEKISDRYHNINLIKKYVNVRIIFDGFGRKYLQAIKYIHKNKEIFRFYGFIYWLQEAMLSSSRKNVEGVLEYLEKHKNDNRYFEHSYKEIINNISNIK